MGESGRPAGVLIAFIQEKWEVRGGRSVVVSEAWWRPRGREVGQKGDSLWHCTHPETARVLYPKARPPIGCV